MSDLKIDHVQQIVALRNNAFTRIEGMWATCKDEKQELKLIGQVVNLYDDLVRSGCDVESDLFRSAAVFFVRAIKRLAEMLKDNRLDPLLQMAVIKAIVRLENAVMRGWESVKNSNTEATAGEALDGIRAALGKRPAGV